MGSFTQRVASFSSAVDGEIDRVMRGAADEVGVRVIKRTPIKTGKAKSNYNIALGAPDITEREATNEHFLHGMGSIPVQGLSAFSIWISNSLPYIGRLERGSSKQAPKGMVRITAGEWQQIVDSQRLTVKR